jgi:hypothetical protein
LTGIVKGYRLLKVEDIIRMGIIAVRKTLRAERNKKK